MMIIFFLLYLSISLVSAKHELYDGYVVYEVYPNNIKEIKSVNNVVNELGLDIWSYANLVTPGQIFVSGRKKKEFENALKAAGIPYKASIKNIKELLELEEQKLGAGSKKHRNSSELTFDDIYTFEQTVEYLEYIADKYPNATKLIQAGSSFEGRPIHCLQISTTGFQNYGKPIIMLQSLLHAREWVTLPPTLYAIHKLVVNVTESEVQNNIDWIIMPVANPDGYIWSRTRERFWRKNRRTGLMPNNTCVGVDLNRNFDINWGTLSSNNVCDETYHGTGPFSESETLTIADVLVQYEKRMTMYADLHSFGSMILYGWGNGTLVPNALIQHIAGVKMAEAIDRVQWLAKPNYRVGNTFAVLQYTVSGGSSDFAQFAGVPYSYTYELPGFLNGTGVNAFLVDPDFIEQFAVETWEGIVAGARHILGIY